jgi:hypothetical protein
MAPARSYPPMSELAAMGGELRAVSDELKCFNRQIQSH